MRGKYIFSEHITEKSKDFQEAIVEKNTITDNSRVFSESSIKSIKSDKALLESITNNPTIDEDIKSKQIEILKKRIISETKFIKEWVENMTSGPNTSISVGYLLKEACELPKVKEFFKVTDEQQTYSSLEQAILLIIEFRSKEIPDDLLLSILEFHVLKYYEKLANFESRLPELKKQLLEKIEQAITDQYLPIDINLAKNRVSRARVEFVDFMKTGLGVEHATHNPDYELIKIGSHLSTEEYAHDFTHEIVHQLSGKTILKRDNHLTSDIQVKHQRSGLDFFQNKKYEWLNEAITESIALYLDKQEDSSACNEGRATLDSFYQKGLSRQVLYNAYFENFNPDAEAGKKVQAWHELVSHLKNNPKLGIKALTKFP